MSEFTTPLSAQNDSLEVVGGKGRSLSRMAKAGFAVPDGFIATANAYGKFVDDNDLRSRILNLARPEVKDARASFASRATRIQALFSDAKVPDEIAAEIAQAYEALDADSPAVAVRSSANAEDLPDLSFAGQQETYLNVAGAQAVVAEVKDCWSSLWTNPAWTPLFAHAVGLVTDIGGILGHGSIVAREYGIPAVVGTGNITQRIRSGQIISVDGDAGTVVLLADEEEKVA